MTVPPEEPRPVPPGPEPIRRPTPVRQSARRATPNPYRVPAPSTDRTCSPPASLDRSASACPCGARLKGFLLRHSWHRKPVVPRPGRQLTALESPTCQKK